MSTEGLPDKCASCGRTPDELIQRLRQEWAQRNYARRLCTFCVRKFTGQPLQPSRPPCAACGATGKALKDGVCSPCRAAGISAPTLFY